MRLNNKISDINGIGIKKEILFNKLNIFTIQDLIEYFPRDYQDRTEVLELVELEIGQTATIKATIQSEPEILRFGNKIVAKLKITDKTDNLEITWFNMPFIKNIFKKGQQYFFTGKIVGKYNKKQMQSPDYELITEENSLSAGRIVPVYASTYRLSQKVLRSTIKIALDNTLEFVEECFPKYMLEKYNLCDRKYALENIHFPKSNDEFFKARRRLVFEELFFMQLSLLNIKTIIKKKTNINFSETSYSDILQLFKFSLTEAQKKVTKEAIQDFNSGYVMNRLIQGDVGSGKTAVAIILSFIAIRNGYQVALMVPTEILAKQHYEYFKSIFESLNIETTLLTGSLTKKSKETKVLFIQSGHSQMIIGTHAIIQENVEFLNLGLVITDEQHRFGVRQREYLSEKGENPHTLVMSATPIPRTLALILYGDLDISIIDELPSGRKKIETYRVNSSYRERIYEFIKKEINCGRQAYVVCPTIEDSETNDLQSVVSYTEMLSPYFKNYKVEYIHGKLKEKIKQDIMQRFVEGEIDIIVSTTVIEVGINVPNATVMLVENCERFGLSQLHQLRGRVGRGAEKSYCILVTDSKSKITRKRTKAMCETNDGFKMSELDLEMRGQGDFFGTRQHGIPEMKITNLYKDMEVLKEVQESVQFIQSIKDVNIEDIFKGKSKIFERSLKNISL